ncbi:unnamed protein product, partial [Prunus brigantina]
MSFCPYKLSGPLRHRNIQLYSRCRCYPTHTSGFRSQSPVAGISYSKILDNAYRQQKRISGSFLFSPCLQMQHLCIRQVKDSLFEMFFSSSSALFHRIFGYDNLDRHVFRNVTPLSV